MSTGLRLARRSTLGTESVADSESYDCLDGSKLIIEKSIDGRVRSIEIV
jgi:hypothetical protein